MKPADAEAWEKHMRLERELLAQRRDGKLAKTWSRWPDRTEAGPRRGWCPCCGEGNSPTST